MPSVEGGGSLQTTTIEARELKRKDMQEEGRLTRGDRAPRWGRDRRSRGAPCGATGSAPAPATRDGARQLFPARRSCPFLLIYLDQATLTDQRR